MKLALDASIHLSFANDNYEPLKYDEVFYLATLGGAEGWYHKHTKNTLIWPSNTVIVLALDKKIGNFEVGKEFDALIVDMDVLEGPTDSHLQPNELLQKFIYCGDDRNVVRVYVAGVEVKNWLVYAVTIIE